MTSKTLDARKDLGLIKPTGESKERDERLLANRIGNAIKGIRSDFTLTSGKRTKGVGDEDGEDVESDLQHPYHQRGKRTDSSPGTVVRDENENENANESTPPVAKRRSLRDRSNVPIAAASASSHSVTPSPASRGAFASSPSDDAFKLFDFGNNSFRKLFPEDIIQLLPGQEIVVVFPADSKQIRMAITPLLADCGAKLDDHLIKRDGFNYYYFSAEVKVHRDGTDYCLGLINARDFKAKYCRNTAELNFEF